MDAIGDVDCSAACSLAVVAASSSGEKINGTSPASLTFCVLLAVGRGSMASSLYLLDMALRLCICGLCGSSWEWRLPAVGGPADLIMGLEMGAHTGPCEGTGAGWNGDVIKRYPPDGSPMGDEKLASGMGTGERSPGAKVAEVAGGLVG